MFSVNSSPLSNFQQLQYPNQSTATSPETQAWIDLENALIIKGISINSVDKTVYTPLSAAVRLNDLNLCKSILSLGCPLNAPGETFERSALVHAIACGFEDISQYLIETGANLDLRDQNDMTYLHFAAMWGRENVCKLLIKKRMDVNALCKSSPQSATKTNSPLCLAVMYGHLNATKILLELGASITLGKNFEHNPFFIALRTGKEEWIQPFLDKGALLDQEDPFMGGGVPLIITLLKGVPDEYRQPMLDLFLKLGMNIEHRFSNERTYLHWAVRYGLTWLCDWLIQHGADINAIDKDKLNVLHHAALLTRRDLIPYLLIKGADGQALETNGFTPLMCLEETKLTAPDEYLELKSADNGLTPLLRKLRMLGLRHSIQGPFFEGSVRFLQYYELAESLESYLKRNPSLPDFLHSFPEMIKSSPHITVEEAVRKLEKGEIVSMSAGWRQHETSIVIAENLLIVGNCGENCGDESGMKLYKIKNLSNLPIAIKTLINNRDYLINEFEIIKDVATETNTNTLVQQIEINRTKAKEKHVEFFNTQIIELLGLERIDYIPKKEQITGNCTWLGAKMSFKGSLILHYILKNPQANLQEIYLNVKQISSKLSKYDKMTALSILQQAEKEPAIKGMIDFEALYEELFALHYLDKEASDKLIQIHPALEPLKFKPTSNLFCHAYKHQNAKLIKKLLIQNVKPKIDDFTLSKTPHIDDILLDYAIQGGIKANIKDQNDFSMLYYFCAKKNKIHALKLLQAWKANGEDLKTIINEPTLKGYSPLMIVLLDEEVENLSSNKELIALLLNCGADPTLADTNGWSILQQALYITKTTEDEGIFKLMLTACPNPAEASTKLSLLTRALCLPDSQSFVVKLLLDLGAKVTGEHLQYLVLPNINKPLLDYFIREGLKLNLSDTENYTPMHMLCINENKDYALNLLKAWASQCENDIDINKLKHILNAQTNSGFTAKNLLNTSKNLESVNELLSLIDQFGANTT